MITYRGIYLDLNESVYTFKYDNLLFYFSSKLYKEKFEKSYINYIKNETLKLRNRYNCTFYADELLLLDLYRKIEKRGFLVLLDNKPIDKNYSINILINKDI